jgi:hypothetical protein
MLHLCVTKMVNILNKYLVDLKEVFCNTFAYLQTRKESLPSVNIKFRKNAKILLSQQIKMNILSRYSAKI